MSENCGSVRCTVAFGQQLANVFHVWFEMESKARTNLSPVLHDVEASTSALKHLQDVVDQDKAAVEGTTRVLTADALQEIETQAIKCDLIFKAIILLIQQAAKKKDTGSDDDDEGKDDGGKETGEKNRGEETDHKVDLLIGPVPDLASPKTVGLVCGMNRKKWNWLDSRLTHCQEQLRWVRKGLFVQLQITKIAQSQMGRRECEDGSFESELMARYAMYVLRNTQIRYIKKRARGQERAQRLRDLKAKRKEKEDNASIKSGSSHTSGKTIVDENAPIVKSTAEKDRKIGVGVNVTPLTPVPPMRMPPKAIAPPAPINVVIQFPPTGMTKNDEQDAPKLHLKTHAEMAKGSREFKPFKTVSSSLSSLNGKVSDTVADWTHNLFDNDDEFTNDRESEELEAWVTRGLMASNPIKVPFGHRRLQYALKLMKSNKTDKLGLTTFHRYIAQGTCYQMIIDDVVREANRLQRRKRVCIAFQSCESFEDRADRFTIVFFSICKEEAPVSFTDCIGRKLTLPFETCKTWDQMKSIIVEAFASTPEIGPHVLEGHYDLLNAKGETILNSLWSTSIRPGDSIKMMMWPKECHPLRNLYTHGPPYVRAGALNARQERILRLHASYGATPRAAPGYRLPMMPAGLHSMPMGQPRYPPVGMPPLGAPPPLFSAARGPPCPLGPPRGLAGVQIIDYPRSKAVPSVSTATTVDENEMTWEEEKQLTFVNYVEELAKTKNVTVPDLLAKFTNLKDITAITALDNDMETYGAKSDSDSNASSCTSRSSSTSSSVVDD